MQLPHSHNALLCSVTLILSSITQGSGRLTTRTEGQGWESRQIVCLLAFWEQRTHAYAHSWHLVLSVDSWMAVTFFTVALAIIVR